MQLSIKYIFINLGFFIDIQDIIKYDKLYIYIYIYIYFLKNNFKISIFTSYIIC